MTILKRLPFFVVLFGTLALVFIGLQAKTVHAQQAIPLGSCTDTVSDDAQLFGSRIVDVLNQAKAINDSLHADTRVVTVSQSELAGSSLKAYYNYIISKCPNWTGPNFIVLVLAKGQEPFLHLGSNFSGKMTAADFQQTQYAQMQGAYQEVYNEAQEPQYLLHAVQTAVQRLESNPQEQIDFQQLTTQSLAQGQRGISQPGYPSESTWAGR